MRNCTVGLIGYGYIGSRVTKRFAGFESRVKEGIGTIRRVDLEDSLAVK